MTRHTAVVIARHMDDSVALEAQAQHDGSVILSHASTSGDVQMLVLSRADIVRLLAVSTGVSSVAVEA